MKNIAVHKYLGEPFPYSGDSVEVKESTLQAAQMPSVPGRTNKKPSKMTNFVTSRKWYSCELECRSRSFLNNGSVQAEQNPNTNKTQNRKLKYV